MLELVYTTTPPSDRGLRDIIAEICTSYINDSSGTLLLNSRFEAIIRKDGALALDVLVRIHGTKRAVDTRVESLERSLIERDEKLSDAGQKVKRMQEELSRARTQLEFRATCKSLSDVENSLKAI